MSKYKIINKNDTRIANIIIKSTLINDLKREPEYSRALRDVTKYSLTDMTESSLFELDRIEDLEMALRDAKKFGFRLAVLWFEGNWPTSNEWEPELLNKASAWDANGKWICAGHILARKNRTPEFHNQCIVFNLEYHRILYMNMDKGDGYPTFSMSDDHIHDDYTPLQLIPSYEDQEIDDDIPTFDTVNRTFDVLTFPIKISLKHGFAVHNLDFDLRNKKASCYPEDDVEDTKTLFWQIMNQNTNPDILKYGQLILEEDKLVLLDKLMNKKNFYETVKDTSISGKDEYSTLGAQVAILRSRGIDKLDFIVKNINSLKKIVWYDDNKFTLHLMEHIINHWDGKDFKKWFDDVYMETMFDNEDTSFMDGSLITEPEHVMEFDEDIMARIKKMDHSFTNYNPLDKEFNGMASLLGVESEFEVANTYEEYIVAYIDFSSIWFCDYNKVLNKNSSETYFTYYKTINDLEKEFDKVFITGYDPSGHLYQNFNTRSL